MAVISVPNVHVYLILSMPSETRRPLARIQADGEAVVSTVIGASTVANAGFLASL